MKIILKIILQTGKLLKDSFISWSDREPFRSSVVIAYYAIFSLPGLLVILINLIGYFYGEQALANQISLQIGDMIGVKAAETVERIIVNTYTSKSFTLSSIISILVFIFGASGLFYQIQQALNKTWKIQVQPEKILLKYLEDRALSFLLMLGFGMILPVSLIISTISGSMKSWVTSAMVIKIEHLFYYIDLGILWGLVTILFAAIYKIMPSAKIRWRDVWPGSLLASILFMIAKYGLSYYFTYSNPGSTYGAAGSIILIMLWTNYNAMILLYGAEFTRLFAERFGKKIIIPASGISNDEKLQVR